MKVVIANHLAANIVDQVFGAPNQHSSLEVLVGIYAYSVQIYADFFGYTNIAIGIALLLGFTFPQNFDAPYSATSITDFWRRWHMTLSRWLRDYLYIPLGGNRGGTLLTYRNLMLTMLIGGLWHGAGWTFVVWGGIHGGALVVERWWRSRPGFVERPWTRGRRAWHRFVTFQVVCFAWIFFRSDSFADAWDLIVRLFTAWGEPSPLVTWGVVAAIAVGIGSQYLPRHLPLQVMARFSRLPIPAQAVVLSFALLVIHAMGPGGRGTVHLLPVLMETTRHPTRRPRRRTAEGGRRLHSAGSAIVVSARRAPRRAAPERTRPPQVGDDPAGGLEARRRARRDRAARDRLGRAPARPAAAGAQGGARPLGRRRDRHGRGGRPSRSRRRR